MNALIASIGQVDDRSHSSRAGLPAEPLGAGHIKGSGKPSECGDDASQEHSDTGQNKHNDWVQVS